MKTITRFFSVSAMISIVVGCGASLSDPSLTPASTATISGSPKIESIGNHVIKEDSLGSIRVLGEAENNGNADASFVKVKCSFYDLNSNLIGDDFSYIVGRSVRLVQSSISTNTALKPGDKGAFEILTSVKKSSVARYDCTYTYDVYKTEQPYANLIIKGSVNAQSDTVERLELLGQVENTGSKGLTFGQVYFVVRDKNGKILDLDYSYINGQTVVLPTGSSTDTALNINTTGTFSVSTSTKYSEYGSFEPKYEWDDAEINNGIASYSLNKPQQRCCVIIDEYEKALARNRAIEKIRNSLIVN